MRSVMLRLAVLVLGVVVVASCDYRPPTLGNTAGLGGGEPNVNSLSVVIDSPVTGAQIVVGDSVFVRFRLQDNQPLSNAVISGVTEQGSLALGTYTQTDRYIPISVPTVGVFRQGLRDTTIRRYLQPATNDATLDSVRVIVVGVDSSGTSVTASKVVHLVAGP